jgi:hypothetical protein
LAFPKGFVTARDLKKLTGPSTVSLKGSNRPEDSLSLSDFSSLLSDNMKDRYFPKGNVLYREGELGNSMLFINSGMLEGKFSFYVKICWRGSFYEESSLTPRSKLVQKMATVL